MPKSENPLDILKDARAVMKGHFVLKSGRHASVYINKDAVYMNPKAVAILCMDMGQPFVTKDPSKRIEIVVGPAIGGVILASYTAKHLGFDGDDVLSLFADKDGDGFVIKRGYDAFVRGKHVLVVEDIMTTGGSVRGTIQAVEAVGGTVMGVAALCNRGKLTADALGVPKLVSLVEMSFDTWVADDCELCRTGQPINIDVGHGKRYVEKFGQPTG